MAALAGKQLVLSPPFLPYRLSPRDEEILLAFGTYQKLTVLQVVRLFYKPTILNFARDKLRQLKLAGFLAEDFLPRATRLGSSPIVYLLGQKGVAYLRALGMPLPRYRPPEGDSYAFIKNPHDVALSDTLISLAQLARFTTTLEIAALRHERVLPRTKVTTLDEQGRAITTTTRPDAWADLSLSERGTRERLCLAIEQDMASEHELKWRKKVRGHLAWVQGPYQDAYQTTALTIAVVTTGGAERVTRLVAWTRDEIDRHGFADVPAVTQLYVFSSHSPVTTPPRTFWRAPTWRTPASETPVAAIPTKEALPG